MEKKAPLKRLTMGGNQYLLEKEKGSRVAFILLGFFFFILDQIFTYIMNHDGT